MHCSGCEPLMWQVCEARLREPKRIGSSAKHRLGKGDAFTFCRPCDPGWGAGRQPRKLNGTPLFTASLRKPRPDPACVAA
jgi:hypothetical protein